MANKNQQAAAISDLKPNAGSPGSKVTIVGSHFTGISKVVFTSDREASFKVISDTEIEATVPVGAVAGPIQIFTANGVVVSMVQFMVQPH